MSTKVRFFDPAKNYLKHKEEIDHNMQDVLARGDLILRVDVEDFEDAFAEYVGTDYAVGVASGTDALILSLVAAGLKPGEIVLCPSYTFRATIEAVVHAGGTPVLYDLDGEVTIDESVRFAIVAHIAGEVKPFSLPSHMILIEDAAQAVGAAPVTGLTACYSFYPAKILGCYGDGGAIATNDKALYEKLKIMRNHFKGDWGPVGYNSRLDNLQAAVLNVKIHHLPKAIQRRKEIAAYYDEQLADCPVVLPTVRAVYQDYILECMDMAARDGLFEFLAGAGIETLKNGYPFPDITPKLPMAQAYEDRTLRIPCNPDLTDEEISFVATKINDYFKR